MAGGGAIVVGIASATIAAVVTGGTVNAYAAPASTRKSAVSLGGATAVAIAASADGATTDAILRADLERAQPGALFHS